jgi:hypothetical protein
MYAHRYQLRLIFGIIITAIVVYVLANLLIVRTYP